MAAQPLKLTDAAEAEVRQDVVSSAHRSFDARGFGLRTFPGFLAECIRKRVWEHDRKLEGGGTQGPVTLTDFITKPYPVGIGASLDEIDRIVSRDPEIAAEWSGLTGRAVSPSGTRPIAAIRVPEGRQREPTTGKVKALADSIEQVGLLNPISVTPADVLVAGWHRLEACKSLGWEWIPVRVTDLDALHTELAEIDENLVRLELTVLERSEQLQRRMEIYQALHPETKHGETGRGRGKNRVAESATLSSQAATFADDTAAKTGRSSRVIREEVQIAKALDEETKSAVRGTPVADRKTDLLEIAREPEPERRRQLVQEKLSGPRTVKPSEIVARAFRLVERMSNAERLDFDRQIRPLIQAAEGA